MYQVDFNNPIHVHFMGIGGISMSGLAEILLSRDFFVSGSDMKKTPLTEHLEDIGAKIFYGQRESNITDEIDLMVYTAAISPDNPEYKEVLRRNIPSITRAELLGQLMKNFAVPVAISGTHGKTTTTSMVSEMMLAADMDPTLSIGGILHTIGGNLRIGRSDYFVTEACEYTNSYLSFFPKVSIILNIDADHLDFFKDINDIRDSFHRFAKLLPADGMLIINGDIDNLSEITEGIACKYITFGRTDKSDYYPTDITYDEFGHPTFMLNHDGKKEQVKLSVVGEHNVYNSCSALALADYLHMDRAKAIESVGAFTGTDRRFQKKGMLGDITIIDDYAHHPTEISATLKAAKNYPHNRLWVVFQPHTYTRTKALLDDFAKALTIADNVILTDIYAAREKNTVGISSKDLKARIDGLHTDTKCYYFPTFDEIENFVLENCTKNDLLITMGAGDVVKIGESLLGQ